VIAGLLRFGEGAARVAADALWPPRCLSCGAGVDQAGRLCPACWQRIDFIAEPLCRRCGLPFAFAIPGEDFGATECGACLRQPPPFDRARAAMRYGDASRKLILAFKHGDRTDAAPALAAWLARAAGGLLGDCDVIAPVPLNRWRLLRRRYNQAALLAQALARRAGKPVAVDALRRLRATPSQGGLTAAQRRTNVRGAFAVRPRWADRIAGRGVLLVDDVMTTGATVEACARALRAAGAARVDVVTLARVVRETADIV
jgi:ComF family protein